MTWVLFGGCAFLYLMSLRNLKRARDMLRQARRYFGEGRRLHDEAIERNDESIARQLAANDQLEAARSLYQERLP